VTVVARQPARGWLRFGAAPAWALGGMAVGALLLGSACVGAVPIEATHVLGMLGAAAGVPVEPTWTEVEHTVLWKLRLPRVLLSALVGAGLSVAGALTQGLFRNPLAEPGLLGVSAGSGLFAALAIVAGASTLSAWLATGAVAASAFVGGLLTTALVAAIATVDGRPSVTTMLLAGIAVSALAGAGLGLLLTIADDAQLRSITFWMMGSMGGATWPAVGLAALGAGLPALWSLRWGRALDALLLGVGEAERLGVDTRRVQGGVVAVVALVVGVCTSLCGVIAFLGLVVPHVARRLVGPGHRRLLPLSLLLGAGLLTAADLVSRTVVAPAELPVGLITTLLGGPFFLGQLVRQRRRL